MHFIFLSCTLTCPPDPKACLMLFIFTYSWRRSDILVTPAPQNILKLVHQTQSQVLFSAGGLHPIRTQFDLDLVDEGFWNHLNGNLTGKIGLIEVQASEFRRRQAALSFLPGKLKRKKACWRTLVMISEQHRLLTGSSESFH